MDEHYTIGNYTFLISSVEENSFYRGHWACQCGDQGFCSSVDNTRKKAQDVAKISAQLHYAAKHADSDKAKSKKEIKVVSPEPMTFDELIRKVVKIPPLKPKKGSKPPGKKGKQS